MSIDWTTRPWWHRPLAAVVVGISAGLSLTWLISGLPFPENIWAVGALIAVGFAFCIWQLIDLRRTEREFKAKVAEWKRLEGDAPQDGHRRRDPGLSVTAPEEFPVVDLVLPMPLALAGAIMRAVGEACEEEGYEAFFRQADGLGRLHARKVDGR